jgi:hypothetical protein
LNKPLRLNGFMDTFLGRMRLPLRGTSSPPCTFSIFLMIDGAVASFPVKGSPPAVLRRGYIQMAFFPKTPKLESWNCLGFESRDFVSS